MSEPEMAEDPVVGEAPLGEEAVPDEVPVEVVVADDVSDDTPADQAAPESKPEPSAPEPLRWYAVQSYSGHENKVQRLIQHRIEEEPGPEAERELRTVLVPTQEVTEIRNGKRIQVTKRLYPGYVLVQMDLNDRTKHIINGIQGVIKFVGSGKDPQPLRDEEINKILGVEVEDEKGSEEEIPFQAGQVVEVMQGPFTDFSGTIQEVYPDKGKVKVEVSLFGRPTSVELDFTQLKGF